MTPMPLYLAPENRSLILDPVIGYTIPFPIRENFVRFSELLEILFGKSLSLR
jgi:hypothetical protein